MGLPISYVEIPLAGGAKKRIDNVSVRDEQLTFSAGVPLEDVRMLYYASLISRRIPKEQIAVQMGVSLKTIYNWADRYGLDENTLQRMGLTNGKVPGAAE